jgi:hypothetical protein
MMRWLREASIIINGCNPDEAGIEWDPNGKSRIVVGEFIDTERPEFTDNLHSGM